ncbi:MAG TPA: hypothetical protein PK878_17825 [bacterium]|nr:hypothetical protein [Candidatus Omnitrophota bacterium]HOJ62144.1 hypothetical protein [bacterium]HPP01619.1 hypothetical protein [bacterium]
MNRFKILGMLLAGWIIGGAGLPAAAAESPFAIRGTLPWHNFLSGPTAWNFEDYQTYLDWMAKRKLNFIGFHCYTGGSERYVNYVEPWIEVRYRRVLPLAQLDTSLTARWGYWPMSTREFVFRSGRLFKREAFGAECAVRARDNEDHYRRARELMRNVIDYAHQKDIQVCLGFEFGVYPPEFYSVIPPEAMLYATYLPDPTHPANIELLGKYIEAILTAYPRIDYIWFWLQEMQNPLETRGFPPRFQKYYDTHKDRFSYLTDERQVFNGVWSLAYVQKAYELLRRKAPHVRMAISGWGGGNQLPPLLKGLHEALPSDIIFSCLNPSQGWDPQVEFMGKMENREVWVIPWLEGDIRLWHPQPRVSVLAEHIALARRQGIEGVIGIHWRTEDIQANLDALGLFTTSVPEIDGVRLLSREEKIDITSAFYAAWCEAKYGPAAAGKIAPILTRFDVDQVLAPRRGGVESPEYFPYHPSWGRMTPEIREDVTRFQKTVESVLPKAEDKTQRSNLEYLNETLRGILALEQVGIHLEPACQLKEAWLAGIIPEAEWAPSSQKALDAWNQAPFADLFEAFSRRVRTRGDLGVLSSMNQKLWGLAQELRAFWEANPKP